MSDHDDLVIGTSPSLPAGVIASKTGSAFVDPENVLEGEVISKADINQTADAWNYAEDRVSDVNIREEGLARANFRASNSWAHNQGSTSSDSSAFEQIQFQSLFFLGWNFFHSAEAIH